MKEAYGALLAPAAHGNDVAGQQLVTLEHRPRALAVHYGRQSVSQLLIIRSRYMKSYR